MELKESCYCGLVKFIILTFPGLHIAGLATADDVLNPYPPALLEHHRYVWVSHGVDIVWAVSICCCVMVTVVAYKLLYLVTTDVLNCVATYKQTNGPNL